MVLNNINGGRALRIAAGITALITLLLGSAGAAVLTVDDSGGAMYTSIQNAIDNANAGDTVEVRSGTYYERVNVSKRLTLRGVDMGSGMPVIDSWWWMNPVTLSADGITLEGFNVIRSGTYPYPPAGIMVSSNNNTIINNIVSNNQYYSIYLDHSSNNNITGNTINDNNGNGIYLWYSNNNNITGNTISNNIGEGIYIIYSNNNIITGNNVSSNKHQGYASGIRFHSSNNNTIAGNTVNNNDWAGISLYSSSSNNTIKGNNASNNNRGIVLVDSGNNIIYLNSFINNLNVLYYSSVSNIWNSTEKIAYIYNGNQYLNYTGNYWSDYTGPDVNGDGIGDSRYDVGSDADGYPIVAQWGGSIVPVEDIDIEPIDNTPPTTTDNSPPTWQNTDFTVTLNCTDSESGCKETHYSIDGGAPQTGNSITISTDGDHTIEYYSVDNAGNEESHKTTHAKLDKTAPTIDGAPMTQPNTNGWYNTDVTVRFTCEDTTSGPVESFFDVFVDVEGWNQIANGKCVDKAGNEADKAVTGINIDRTLPAVSIASPEPKDYIQTEIVSLSLVSTDALSDIASTTASIDGTTAVDDKIDLRTLTLGLHTLTAEAVDKAGNKATTSVTFSIKPAPATVDVKPDTLNKASQSGENAVTAYIETPGYDVNLIDAGTVTMSTGKGSVPAQLLPTEIGDYDSDGLPDKMVKFDRQAVVAIVDVGDKVRITINGKIDGAVFEGSDEIRIVYQGRK